jgi:GNAT superfamily N-acetyltransferase
MTKARADWSLPAIHQIASAHDVTTARGLLREYQALLGVDLSFQGFEDEVNGLPGDYAAPGGRLLLATHDGAAVGCVAVRAFHGSRCEMKRLFVRSSARGLGVGGALVSRVLDEARAIGYLEIVLDTLPMMADAQRLYEQFGFREISAYRPNPIAGTRYLGKSLV